MSEQKTNDQIAQERALREIVEPYDPIAHALARAEVRRLSGPRAAPHGPVRIVGCVGCKQPLMRGLIRGRTIVVRDNNELNVPSCGRAAALRLIDHLPRG